ncbi:hypothetical protein D3C85_1591960 [compost metagenome]
MDGGTKGSAVIEELVLRGTDSQRTGSVAIVILIVRRHLITKAVVNLGKGRREVDGRGRTFRTAKAVAPLLQQPGGFIQPPTNRRHQRGVLVLLGRGQIVDGRLLDHQRGIDHRQ